MSLAFQQSQSFTKGISDDRFNGNGFCGDAEGVDIRRSSRGVFLAQNTRETVPYSLLTIGTATGSAWRQYAYIELYQGGSTPVVHVLYDSGLFNLTTGANYLYGSLAGARNIIRVSSGGVNYGVVLRASSTGGVWRRNDDTSDASTATNYMNLSSNTSDYRPVLVSSGYMYVGGNGTVDAINITTSTWVKEFTVTVPGNVRGLTEIGDQIYIYSEDGMNGYKMSWNGVSNFPQYIQKRSDNPVLNVANMGNYDYVVTGTGEFTALKYRRLWLSQGFDKTLILGSDFIEYEKQPLYFSPIHTNAIEIANNIVYIGGRGYVHAYGTGKATMGPSLSKDIVIPDAEQITAMYLQGESFLYVAYYDASGVNRIIKQDIRPGHKYGLSGSISTPAFDGGDIETEKNNNRIIVGYKLPNSTTSIDIYTRINGFDERVFVINTPTNAPARGDTYTKNGVTYTVKSYNSAKNEVICSADSNGPYNSRILRASGTIAKVNGAGDTTLTFTDVSNFKFIASITDTTKRKANISYSDAWYDLEIKAVLKSSTPTNTPELYSIKTLFDFNDKQDG